MRKILNILILSVLFSAVLCSMGYDQAYQKKNAASAKSAAQLVKQSALHANSRSQSQAANSAMNANAAKNRAAYYAAGQRASRNANSLQASKNLQSNIRTKAASQYRRGSNKVYRNYYNKIKTSSDISCKKLKRYEKVVKRTYYNAAKYQKKVVYSDVQVLRKAKAQLQSIIGYALKQAYIKSGYQNQASQYKNAAQYKQANSAAYNLKKQGYLKKRAASAIQAKGGKGAYHFFFVQQQKMVYDKLNSLKSETEEQFEYTRLIEESSYKINQICNRYQKTMTTIVQSSCKNLNNLANLGTGYDYCKRRGLQIGQYIKQGYLARSQLCHAGSSLKYLKQIYSGVYDLYSGYRSQYLNKAYGRIYARRKNICSQDDIHSQIYHSTVAKARQAVQSKRATRYGNRQVLIRSKNQAQKAAYLNKYKRASGSQAARRQYRARAYARANKQARHLGRRALLKRQRAYAAKRSVTTKRYQVQPKSQYHFFIEDSYDVTPAYTTPYVAPYVAKRSVYGGSYVAKRPVYGAKRSVYGAKKSVYGSSYGPKMTGYGAKRSTYAAKRPAYAAKKSVYGASYQMPTYGASYGVQRPVYNRVYKQAPYKQVAYKSYKPKVYKKQYKVVVYPKRYQQKKAVLVKARAAYKNGYKSGYAQGKRVYSGAQQSKNYYYSGYFLEGLKQYAQPRSYKNQYKTNKVLRRAYKHGHKNGYKRARRYQAIKVRRSAYASAYNRKSGYAKKYQTKPRVAQAYPKVALTKKVVYAPKYQKKPVVTAYYKPHYGVQLASKGHRYQKAKVIKANPKTASLQQCQSSCNSYAQCNSIAYKKSSKSCQLYPHSYFDAIDAGLYTSKKVKPGKHDNYHVLYFVQRHAPF